MVKMYESKHGGSIQISPDKVIELTGKEYITDDEEVQKLIESLKGFGDYIWEVTGVIAEQKKKRGRPKLVTGPRSAEV